MTLGKRIKTARERLRPKMTQADVGEHFGISDKAVSGWERGDSMPELDKIAKLARLLKVPSSWLLEGRGAPPPPDSVETGLEMLDQDGRDLVASMVQTLLKQRGAAA